MSRKQTRFIELPNEMICCIFDFLTNMDILRAFAQLNHRYDDLIRFYIKQIDLTDGWEGDRQQLEVIRETIHILIVDQYYVHLLGEPGVRENLQHNEKFSLCSIVKRIFTRSKNPTTTLEWCLDRRIPMVDYQFPQLHSLQLVNVNDWSKVVSSMNLKNLSLWFHDEIRYYDEDGRIPPTIIRFSTNAVIEPKNFHVNLIDLTVSVRTIVQLFKIVEHTPNLQHLRVVFADFFHEYCRETSDEFRFLEATTTDFCCLKNLNLFSFSTKQSYDLSFNEHLPLDQIQVFIDRCCPNKTILKRVSFKLDHIVFNKDIWSSIVRYKNTFDRFDFYASFIAKDNTSVSIIISLINDQFDYYIEATPVCSKQPFVHIYTLPFAFDRLHTFAPWSELSSQISFSANDHLYSLPTCRAHPISLESLAKRMPYIISVDGYSFGVIHDMVFTDVLGYAPMLTYFNNMFGAEVMVDQNIFDGDRVLRFCSGPEDPEPPRCKLLSQLFDQIPQCQCLINLHGDFISLQRPLLSIKRLDLRLCYVKSIDTLVQCLPNLSTLLLAGMAPNVKELVQRFSFLFIGISSLKLICFKIDLRSGNENLTRQRRIALQVLTRMQKMDHRLYHLKLDHRPTEKEFCLYNL